MWNILLWTILSLPLLYLFIIYVLKKFSHRPAPPTHQSQYYLSAESSAKPGKKLESIKNINQTIELSVIVPAYNEELRLKTGLRDALHWLENNRSSSNVKINQVSNSIAKIRSYEVLIVDDGSTDRTVQIATELAHQHAHKTNNHPDTEIRVISLGKNRGKGGAVRHGILHARGEMILYIDADGATKFSDLSKLITNLKRIQVERPRNLRSSTKKNKSSESNTDSSKSIQLEKEFYGIAVGSRAHLVSSPTVVSRSKFRNFLMKAFHLYLVLLGLKDIRDTQCGFKLMTRPTAIKVVDGLHVEGWIFDVELLLRAKLMRPSIPIIEVPIEWEEIQGSKLSVFKDSLIMAIELFLIRINYLLGVWKLD